MLRILIICLSLVIVRAGLEVVLERVLLDYYNPKYVKWANITQKRKCRRCPHIFNVEGEILTGVGNNVTLSYQQYELISGRYILIPVHNENKLCDFLYKDNILGKMYAKQLPGNWTCPFPPGEYHMKDLEIHLENFQFEIPYTFGTFHVNTRMDTDCFLTHTKEMILKVKGYSRITQKSPKDKPKRNKNGNSKV